MYVDTFETPHKLVIMRGFNKLRELKREYRAAHAKHSHVSPIVLHFRYATHGGMGESNCHPHTLDNGRAGLVHNGMLSHDSYDRPKGESDTVYFCKTMLAHRSAEQLTDGEFGNWLADVIGFENKFVILDDMMRLSIVNEGWGTWEGQIWFSNTSHHPKPGKLPAKSHKLSKGKIDPQWCGPEWAEADRTTDELVDYMALRDETRRAMWDATDEEEWKRLQDALRIMDAELNAKLVEIR